MIYCAHYVRPLFTSCDTRAAATKLACSVGTRSYADVPLHGRSLNSEYFPLRRYCINTKPAAAPSAPTVPPTTAAPPTAAPEYPTDSGARDGKIGDGVAVRVVTSPFPRIVRSPMYNVLQEAGATRQNTIFRGPMV